MNEQLREAFENILIGNFVVSGKDSAKSAHARGMLCRDVAAQLVAEVERVAVSDTSNAFANLLAATKQLVAEEEADADIAPGDALRQAKFAIVEAEAEANGRSVVPTKPLMYALVVDEPDDYRVLALFTTEEKLKRAVLLIKHCVTVQGGDPADYSTEEFNVDPLDSIPEGHYLYVVRVCRDSDMPDVREVSPLDDRCKWQFVYRDDSRSHYGAELWGLVAATDSEQAWQMALDKRNKLVSEGQWGVNPCSS